VVTAGGFVFTGSASDRMVRAYDADSGRVLWERELASNPQGTPAVYEVDGRQYVVFFAESSARGPDAVWKRSPAEAQGYYAFALR
jgi:quinoprotein glucose dehydrogenase